MFMQKALQGKNKVKFPVPDGIRFERVDVTTGSIVGEGSKDSMIIAVNEDAVKSPVNLPEKKTANPILPD